MTREPDSNTDQMAREVIGAAVEVHRELGPGYLESVYEEAMAIELGLRGIPFERQKCLAVNYKGHSVGTGRVDFLAGNCLLVELKAVEAILPIHRAQVMSYLKTRRLPLALLINFNVPLLRDGVKRIVLAQQSDDPNAPSV